MTEEILSVLNGEVFGVWFLIGAALVFWMQAGFAMVEAGFTRAKNTGNILMKNLMDFCIGTSCIHSDRLRPSARRRHGRHHRKTRIRYFYRLCKF